MTMKTSVMMLALLAFTPTPALAFGMPQGFQNIIDNGFQKNFECRVQ